MFKTCAINGKAVKRLYINGRLAYSSVPDAGALVNGEASADYGMGSPAKLGESSYVYNGSTYNYSVYDTKENLYAGFGAAPAPKDVKFTGPGAGNDDPWYVSPHVVATAAHWGSALKTGEWSSSASNREYAVSGWTNLKDWALANGWTEEQLRGTDIGDVVVAKNTHFAGELLSADCPLFVKKSTVNRYFWNGSLKGVVGFHAPQPVKEFSVVSLPAECYPIVWQPTGGDPQTILDESGIEFETVGSESYALKAKDGGATIATFWQFGGAYAGPGPDAQVVTFGGAAPVADTSPVINASEYYGTMMAPVVFSANSAWGTPKVNYTYMDSRSAELKATLSALDPTYLAYVGDSGKPTWFMFDGKPVVVSQCHSQFAGPDFAAFFDVLKAYVESQGDALKELTPEMVEQALSASQE